jgi:hypothetical protein
MKPKLKTYLRNLDNGLIQTKTDIVLQLIYYKPNITIHEIRQMGVSHQSATGVLSALMDDGVVFVSGEVKIKNRHYSMLQYEGDLLMRKVRAENRLYERFTNWLKNMDEFQSIIGHDKIEAIKQVLIGANE